MPRAIVPGQLNDDKILKDLQPQFSQYPANEFEFILGAASSLDANSNSFTVTLNKGGQKAVKYDHLIIATLRHSGAFGYEHHVTTLLNYRTCSVNA
ncbi:uncharacterized protein Triagg1_1582 [Trichoderma aggressivum f. europaeum]|uniref:Uncharacterized protein n=1 Tax=Trichoderma aggressivum f. europaeum TaxID=173218 RepID=A0AAE1IHR7_9HYPO|nr:hypothetical protein Triagg1_1582 [Trichoderma aggressivum f. europaeum]